MKITILTNEYPPNIYGGAGVHVKYLVRELARYNPVQVYAFGEQEQITDSLRRTGCVGYRGPRGYGSSL